ncbi:hypothetical protein [Nocardia otitidiscaviarum]|uniref:hypothetical protein n=1 Tax=Nocardia otitidiscaviarum TaxID=1823 RepID=UPI0004A6BC9F|nr:hypothetical protein [Nocardia otitidiscaviarum]
MTGPISYQHRDDGIWPVGEDGWPVTAEELDMLERSADPLAFPSRLDVIDIEPESVTDTEQS